MFKNSRTGEIHTVEKIVILVVEDEAIIRLSAAQILEQAGFLVVEAHNADVAIQILESRGDIRAVFTDIEMPGSLCGLKLARAIRDRWPPIHLIMTSGLLGASAFDFPRLARFIAKPYLPDDVIVALTELLASTPISADFSQMQH